MQALFYTPVGQQVLQQIQVWANNAGVSIEIYIANNLLAIQYMLDQVGRLGPAIYEYTVSGQAWNDIYSGVQWLGDKAGQGVNWLTDKAGNAIDGVKNWFNHNSGGGGTASPGGPDWDQFERLIQGSKVKFNQSSLDKAFNKHRDVFGNYTDGSKDSVNQFKNDRIDFIDNTSIHFTGSYRGQEGIHVINPITRQWIFINSNGFFNTAFQLNLEQLRNLFERGSV